MEEEPPPPAPFMTERLRVLALNVKAAANNVDITIRSAEIQDVINDLQPDVAFLLEVDTSNYKVNETYSVRGYKQFASNPARPDNSNNRKTRAIALIKFGVVKSSDQIKKGVGDRAEVWLDLRLYNGRRMVVAGVYHEWFKGKACRDEPGFLKMLDSARNHQTIVMGDFNRCILKSRDKPESLVGQFVDSVESRGLRVVEAGTTYYKEKEDGTMYSSGLDWGITTMDELELFKEWTSFSDHAAIYVDVTGGQTKRKRLVRYRNKESFHSTRSQAILAENNWEEVYLQDERDVTEMTLAGLAANLTAKILAHRDVVAPEKEKVRPTQRNQRDNPRLASIRRAISNAIRSGRHKAIIRLKRRYRNVSRQIKINKAEEIMTKEGPGAVWKLFRDITEPDRVSVSIVESGIVLTARNAAENLLGHFVRKVDELRSKTEPDGDEVLAPLGPANKPFEFRRVEEKEVINMISRMKNTNSKDNQGLTQTDMKKLVRAIVVPLTKIVNVSLLNGIFPEVWKTARVVPAAKPGKNPDNLASYRPLSMLVPFGKLIENAAKIQIQEHAVTTGAIPHSQHGYQAGRSTDTALAVAMRTIDEALKRRKKCAVLLFDFSCAFDLIDFRLLDEKLLRLGYGRSVRKWVRSYLANRTIYVEVDGVESRRVVLEYGSPQGSIISPLLFLLLICEMDVNVRGQCIGYCDDTSIVVAAHTVEELRTECEDAIKDMKQYSSRMGLALNVDKTEVIALGGAPLGRVVVDGVALDESSEVRFLGTHLSKRRSLKTHVDKLVPKLNARICKLRRVRNCLPLSSLKTVAKATVGGAIQSCLLTAMDPIRERGDAQINRLQRSLNCAARVVLRKGRSDRTSSSELMKELQCDSVRKQATVKLFKAAFKVHSDTGTMKYLATTDTDKPASERLRREKYKNLLPEWQDGHSLTWKSRSAWNILEELNLSRIKQATSVGVFESLIRANYTEIENQIFARRSKRG